MSFSPADPNTEPDRREFVPLKSIQNELIFEFVFILICFVLALSLNFKIAATIVLVCLKFAFPDWVTAFLIFRKDPSRGHGMAVALLFIATGFARASQVALIALVVATMTIVPLLGNFGMAQAAGVGLFVGFGCAFGFLAAVFPLTWLAWIISGLTKTKLWFATGLTKLRRSKDEKKTSIPLNVPSSLRKISLASSFGLACWMVFVLLVLPIPDNLALLYFLAIFAIPLLWIYIFEKTVIPQD